MLTRLLAWTGRMLVCADQLLACWLRGWFYVWLGRGELPSADETLSAFVGRHAIAGKRWALVAERVIDAVMTQRGHCRAAIARDDED